MEVSKDQLAQFISCLKSHSDFDLSQYSQNSLMRRIEKVLQDYMCDFDTLISSMQNDQVFLHNTLKKITVNTTELFRDFKMWQELRHSLLPELKEKPTLNIWHAGCSTGQEVYSMLILLNELGMLEQANIYASDINEDVIAKAKEGVFPYRHIDDYKENFNRVIKDNPYGKAFNHLPFDKYFDVNKKKDFIKVDPLLSERVTFFVHDLVKMRNIFEIQFDIIICRNVLIYFNSDLQKKVYNFFHQNLADKSYLILGMQESVGWFMNSMFDKKSAFYQKK